MTTFKLGKDKVTGRVVSIAEAKRGHNCGCVCPDCGKDFVAAKGNKNDWHFRHYNETFCKGGQETALHMLAKEIIVSNTQICLPEYGTIFYDHAVQEKYFQKIQPDVTANTNGQNLFFEVLVTHPVDMGKESFYVDGEHKSVEIILQHYTFTNREDLEEEILKNCDNKRVIFWEKKFVTKQSYDYLKIFGLLFVAVLGFFMINSPSQRRRA